MSANYNLDDLMSNIFDINISESDLNSTPSESFYYNVNPKNASKEIFPDGHYHSKIRLLLNPHDINKQIMGHTIVHQSAYYIEDADGGVLVRSKLGESAIIGAEESKKCPIFRTFCSLYYSRGADSERRKEFAKSMFDKRESDYILIQVIEDKNRPELNGKLLVFKLPRKSLLPDILGRLSPSDGKPAEPLLDYLIGPVLNIDVTPGPDDPNAPERKNREISYALCRFDNNEYEPVRKTDGTNFFTDSELELIETYERLYRETRFAKTASKRDSAQKQYAKIKDSVGALYIKALKYLEENAPNLHDIVGYHEWDDALAARVNKWCAHVRNMTDPRAAYGDNAPGDPARKAADSPKGDNEPPESKNIALDDIFNEDLPF